MIGAVVYARCDSSRFPNKALHKLGDKRLIEWTLDALKSNEKKLGYKLILASTDRAIDKPLGSIAEQKGIDFFAGSLNDLAKRTIDCSKKYELKSIIRINGDSPFVNIPLLKDGIKIYEETNSDLVSNIIDRSYPYGISFEMFNCEVFETYYNQFDTQHKEHITSYFYKNQSKFKIYSMPELDHDLQFLKLTVDTKQDLKRLNTLLEYMDVDKINYFPIRKL